MRIKKYLLPAFMCVCTAASAQYAPQAGIAGSTAINKSSTQIAGWASGCTVQRGWLDIADPSLGTVTAGDDVKGTGAADNNIVSLGDSGTAVLTFPSAIYNGPGADFAVFENGFINPSNGEEAFLELAFVEVSSDGVQYYRFPADARTPENPQVPSAGVYMNARHLNNLAGKYAGGNGTPFDLEELKGQPGLDVNNITHIRLVDVIGTVGVHATTDTGGRKINDPYPTPFPGGGFDLDAVGAMYLRGVGIAHKTKENLVTFYPNPVTDMLYVQVPAGEDVQMTVSDVSGRGIAVYGITAASQPVSFSGYGAGVYYLHFRKTDGHTWVEKVVKY